MYFNRLILSISIFLSLNAWTLNKSYDRVAKKLIDIHIKEGNKCFENIGIFFEHVVSHLLEEKYNKDEYDIIKNIRYKNLINNNAGELDFTIFNKRTNHAICIYEVKCSVNRPKAKRKGIKQLARFKNNLFYGIMPKVKAIQIFTNTMSFNALFFINAELKLLLPKKDKNATALEGEVDLTIEEVQELYSFYRLTYPCSQYLEKI